MSDRFEDIRPYNDSEVSEAIERLVSSKELAKAVATLRLPKLRRVFPWLARVLIQGKLRRELGSVATVRDFVTAMKPYMDNMIEGSTRRLTASGIDTLSEDHNLFISNHRDIALDPAFVNYVLYHRGLETVRIAIGDNLLSKDWASDLMRLNKSFIVPRAKRPPRQMLAAYKDLSAYIQHSLLNDKVNVWIAEREGRAKDGVDRCERAIAKMLCMNMQMHKETLSEYVEAMNIVPVAISYEWDPCDVAKARELETANYAKAEHEDLQSIALGIKGEKGAVHVSFGQALRGDFATVDAIAEEIDRQIIENYVLHPSNFSAYRRLFDDNRWSVLRCSHPAEVFEPTDLVEKRLDERMKGLTEPEKLRLLTMYANPILAKLERIDTAKSGEDAC